MSATTGRVVRTLVRSSNTASVGGRQFAVIGPSGRYVYYADVSGVARVPVGGGAVTQLPDPAHRTDSGDGVNDVFADRSDTHIEETLGYDDDRKPFEVWAGRVGSTSFTFLGSKMQAVGWNATGTTAYLTTAYGATSITGIVVASPSHRVTHPTSRCAPWDAVSPGGQLGWIDAPNGCQTTSARTATYQIDALAHPASFVAHGPSNHPPYYNNFPLQYTPAGSAVVIGYGYQCLHTFPVWIVSTGSGQVRAIAGPGCH